MLVSIHALHREARTPHSINQIHSYKHIVSELSPSDKISPWLFSVENRTSYMLKWAGVRRVGLSQAMVELQVFLEIAPAVLREIRHASAAGDRKHERRLGHRAAEKILRVGGGLCIGPEHSLVADLVDAHARLMSIDCERTANVVQFAFSLRTVSSPDPPAPGLPLGRSQKEQRQ